jgi:hypothetical protein
MTFGRGFWIVVWYGILLLGLVGLWASIAWGRRLRWENLDELLRAIGTIQVSVGMLLLLYGRWPQVATGLLGLALGVFIAAFVAVRHLPAIDDEDDEDDEADTHPALRDRPSRGDAAVGPEHSSSELNREAIHE